MVPLFKPTDPAPGESFAMLHPRGASFAPLWHVHGHFELNHVVTGRGTRWVGTRSERFGDGDIVLLPPDLPHSWNSDFCPAGEGEPRPVEAIVAMFGAALLGGAGGPPEWAAARALLEDAADGLAFDDDTGVVGRRLRRMVTASPIQRLLGLFGVLDLLARLPRHRLARAGDGSVEEASSLALVRKALTRLRDPAAASVRQIDIARDCGVSPSRLSRAFRHVTGGTYAAHVNDMRISRACALLQEGRLSVAQIAFEAGYANLSNFNRRFKATLQQTPKAYRRAFRASMVPASPASAVQ